MNKLINYFVVCLTLAASLSGLKVNAQALVGPAPYCMPLYGAWATPCNQGGPSNQPGNWINDFINSFSTAGAAVNIVNNNSGCNSQSFPNIGQRNYFNHGCQHYMVANPGQVINCTVQSGNVYSQGFAIFIDWNQNNTFDIPGERVAATAGVPPAASFANINFTIPAAQAPGAYRMRVRCAYATSGNNIHPCNQHSYGESEDYTIYIGVTPPGVLTATATSNGPLCNGSQLNLNVATSAAATVALTYTWSGPSTFTSNIPNPTIPNAQVNNSGVYSVTVSPGSCPVVTQVTVNVYPTPTINVLSSNGPICQGDNLILNSSSQTSASVTYSWTGPNAFTGNSATVTIPNAMPVNTGFYTLNIINTFTGAPYTETLTCATVGSFSAEVVPVASLNVVPFFTVCQNTNINLTANAVGATSYYWQGPNNFTTTTQNPSFTNVNATLNGDYSVTAYYTSPSTTLICTSNAVSNVSVVPRNPVVAFSTNNVCQNTTASFSASALSASGYEWFGPNGYSSTTQTNVINNVQPVSSGNYTVNAIFTIGTVSCTTSSYIPINVIPVPSVAVTPTIVVCEREGALMNASA
ncbi:MAG: GEVED domain-containing protein, partial [Bacteroidia bacterium]